MAKSDRQSACGEKRAARSRNGGKGANLNLVAVSQVASQYDLPVYSLIAVSAAVNVVGNGIPKKGLGSEILLVAL